MRDIIFRGERFVFSCRVAGVAVNNGCVLLQKPPQEEGYAIPGGHVMLGETNAQALRREFREELHADITAGPLLAVGEVFFPWGDRPCHQICLYYAVTLDDPGQMPAQGVFHGYDELGGERVDLDYMWVPLQRLAEVTIYPPELADYLLEGRRDVMHFIYRELPEDTSWEC